MDPDDTTGTCIQDTATGIGTFVIQITGLKANTSYHVPAYSINGIDTSYGQDEFFDTYYFPWHMFVPATTGVGKK